MRPLIGAGLVGIGAVMVYGGITGRLAPMLAALFAPTSLTEKGSSEPGIWERMFDFSNPWPGGPPEFGDLIP